MLIIPAIDIRNKKCVRLIQGDPERQTIYSDDPVEMAVSFQNAGAKLIHVVDLDGAFSGNPVNFDIVKRLTETVSIPIEIGGGIRTADTIKSYLDAGIKRIILGTILCEDSSNELIEKYQPYIIAGIDASTGMVATHGWKQVSETKAIDIIINIINKGVREIIYTDISKDGMLEGPNVDAIMEILNRIGDIGIIASGGVSRIEDLFRLKSIGDRRLMGSIVGKAVYDGRINLKEAIEKIEDRQNEK
jgi:phosphoribosylformimino-5-aminoimidazole carboxamide ribotide isomerase